MKVGRSEPRRTLIDVTTVSTALAGPTLEPGLLLELAVGLGAHVAAGLLLLAGLAKVLRPWTTSDALELSHLRAASWLVRLLGAAEIVLAAAVVTIGGPVAFGLLAGAYAAFVLVAARQRLAGRSCGCFGAASTTVGALHLVTNGVAGLVAVAAAALAVPSLPALLPEPWVPAATSLLLLGTAVGLGQMLLTSFPDLRRARALSATGGDR